MVLMEMVLKIYLILLKVGMKITQLPLFQDQYYNTDTQDEFYNGEFSGSQITVTTTKYKPRM